MVTFMELIEQHRHRLASAGLFGIAMASTRLGWDGELFSYFAWCMFGIGISALVVGVWGERTRPKPNLLWFIIMVLLLAAVGSTTSTGLDPRIFRLFPLGILVGFFLLHDLSSTPSLMLGSVVFSAVFHPEIQWFNEGEARAWFIASSALLGVVAATIERERLQARAAHATPWPWTIVRLSIVTLWTLIILNLKEEIEVGRLFASLGADPRGEAGRWALLSILLVALIAATFVFRGRKPAETPESKPPA